MKIDRLSRVRRMTAPEISWRLGAAARIARDRARCTVYPARWDRRQLGSVLSLPSSNPISRAIARTDWQAAHRAIAAHLEESPQRFVIGPSSKTAIVTRILRTFPGSVEDARRRADSIVDGSYALLGYQGLRFDRSAGDVDWHYDPVHDRTAPHRFWADVPFLDPAVGDHKVIWELNRHQHWLALGRAAWLTGDTRYKTTAIRQLESWLRANPPLIGINWASMLELGFRSISWIWALGFFIDHDAEDRSPWLVDLLVALDRQLAHIERNLSHYFSPNTHLLGEGLALYVSGRSLPVLAASGRRERIGRRILLEEISRQIEDDGGHCERSTHYHRYALDFYLLALTIARITSDPAAHEFASAVERLGNAARLLADERGQLPHLGDDDGGLAMPIAGRSPDDVRDSLATAGVLLGRPDLLIGDVPEETFWMLSHPALPSPAGRSNTDIAPGLGRVGSGALPSTGYYVSRGHNSHVVVDAGPHGYLNGGHAHADALSLTLTVRGLPLLIDPGTACYTSNPALRDRFRSSAMHNTATVGGRSQSIAAGPFSWRQTASSRVAKWRTNPSFDYLEASHDGYVPVVHHRHVLSIHDDLLVIADRIVGNAGAAVQLHWHLEPAWQAQLRESRVTLHAGCESVSLTVAGGRASLLRGDDCDNHTGLGWHAPVYGRVEPTSTVQIVQDGGLDEWTVSAFCLDRSNDVIELKAAEGSTSSQRQRVLSMRLVRQDSVELVVIQSGPKDGDSGSKGDAWAAEGLESDAQMLFCRTRHGLPQVGLVDGSFVRGAFGGPIDLRLARTTAHLLVDVAAPRTRAAIEPEGPMADATARAHA